MSAVKQFFKEEAKWEMATLECPNPSMFYLSIWQTKKSVIPMLLVRLALFIASVGIMIGSMVAFSAHFGKWFIYLTHWGLTVNTLATGFAVIVSVRCHFYGPLQVDSPLPWYVKIYWVLYNIAVPLAFLITVFYWTVLSESGIEGVGAALDIAMHGLNSVVMFLLLVASAHPTRLLHMYHPFCFALVYVFFGVIYHFAGGTNASGDPYVYPVVDWAYPGWTLLVVSLTGLFLLLLHFITTIVSAIRDKIAAHFLHKEVVTFPEGIPLRHQGQSNV